MQAGGELSWHLSGPIFAQKEVSSVYSSANVVTAGLRGLLAPSVVPSSAPPPATSQHCCSETPSASSPQLQLAT